MELIIIVALCVAMSRMAVASDRSGTAWGGMTLIACVASQYLIPLPLLRVGIVGIVIFFAMLFTNKMN